MQDDVLITLRFPGTVEIEKKVFKVKLDFTGFIFN